jgi:hypothetical protein
MTFDDIAAALAREGMLLRGGFHPDASDGVPLLPGGTAAGTMLLVGNAGPALWQRFSASAESADGQRDPLDRWTRRILSATAVVCGATPLFPFGGPPYLPFQRWARRAEPVHASPLGVLIHPVYGLWHAYRGALAFAHRIAVPATPPAPSPCESCLGRPCLAACPVDAFAAAAYDAAGCRSHLATGAANCFAAGCLARAACPVGRQYAYAPDQAAFHLRAFACAR